MVVLLGRIAKKTRWDFWVFQVIALNLSLQMVKTFLSSAVLCELLPWCASSLAEHLQGEGLACSFWIQALDS